jgi:hypothetical protein
VVLVQVANPPFIFYRIASPAKCIVRPLHLTIGKSVGDVLQVPTALSGPWSETHGPLKMKSVSCLFDDDNFIDIVGNV